MCDKNDKAYDKAEVLADTRKTIAAEILQHIYTYLVDIADEWLKMDDDRKYELANIQVYNHVRKEMDDLEMYATNFSIEL